MISQCGYGILIREPGNPSYTAKILTGERFFLRLRTINRTARAITKCQLTPKCLGSKESLKGLYTINEDKLQNLNASALEALHRKGHLRDVYMMLASLPNVSRLIDRKNRRLPD